MHAQRSSNKLMWLHVLKSTGYIGFPEDRTNVLHPWSQISATHRFGRLIHTEELCRLTSWGAHETSLLIAQIISFTEAEFASLKSSWEKAKFRLRLLEGHNDIVTCVVAVDSVVVSGR